MSRNTVRKVIRSGATEFSYDRTNQPRPKIDPWRSDLDEMLAENDRQPKRQRLTLVRIYEELRNRGYDGSYDAVRRYAASWSKATREASALSYDATGADPSISGAFTISFRSRLPLKKSRAFCTEDTAVRSAASTVSPATCGDKMT